MNQNKNHYHFADNSNRPLKSNKRPDRRDLLRKRRTPGSNKQPGGKPGGKSKMSLGHRIAFIILLVMLGLFLWKQIMSQTAGYEKITYTRFDKLMNDKNIKSARIHNGTFYGILFIAMLIEAVNPEKVDIFKELKK